MAYNLRKSDKRRQHEINLEPKAEHQKTIREDANAADAEAITNICNELLDQIFNFLDPQSLLNVAGTCKRLQIAATTKYTQKFGKYVTDLYPKYGDDFRKEGIRIRIRMNRYALEVYGRTALPFLRCFGAHITKLLVADTENNHVIRYINQYCAATLAEMEISDMEGKAFTIENCPKPFKMVEKLVIYKLSKHFSLFPYWFPSLQKFGISFERFDFDISSAIFPQMEDLFLVEFLNSCSERTRIERFVRANQQLRYLEIWITNLHFWKLLKLLGGHTLISKLKVGRPNFESKCVKRNLLLRFAREHRAVDELDFVPYLFKADDAIALILELNSLKYFRFRLKNRTEYHYLVNQLQQVVGFMFEADLVEYTKSAVVELNFQQ